MAHRRCRCQRLTAPRNSLRPSPRPQEQEYAERKLGASVAEKLMRGAAAVAPVVAAIVVGGRRRLSGGSLKALGAQPRLTLCDPIAGWQHD